MLNDLAQITSVGLIQSLVMMFTLIWAHPTTLVAYATQCTIQTAQYQHSRFGICICSKQSVVHSIIMHTGGWDTIPSQTSLFGSIRIDNYNIGINIKSKLHAISWLNDACELWTMNYVKVTCLIAFLKLLPELHCRISDGRLLKSIAPR